MLRSRRFVLPVRIVDLIHHLFGDGDALVIGAAGTVIRTKKMKNSLSKMKSKP